MSAQRIQLDQAVVDIVLYIRPSNSLRAELTRRLSGVKPVQDHRSSMGSTCGVYLGHAHSDEEAARLTTALGCAPDIAAQLIHQAASVGMKHDLLLRFCNAVGLSPFSEEDTKLIAAAAADTLIPQRNQ